MSGYLLLQSGNVSIGIRMKIWTKRGIINQKCESVRLLVVHLVTVHILFQHRAKCVQKTCYQLLWWSYFEISKLNRTDDPIGN
jgi:hypothetical protein